MLRSVVFFYIKSPLRVEEAGLQELIPTTWWPNRFTKEVSKGTSARRPKNLGSLRALVNAGKPSRAVWKPYPSAASHLLLGWWLRTGEVIIFHGKRFGREPHRVKVVADGLVCPQKTSCPYLLQGQGGPARCASGSSLSCLVSVSFFSHFGRTLPHTVYSS